MKGDRAVLTVTDPTLVHQAQFGLAGLTTAVVAA